MKKRIKALALFLCLALCISLMPGALAFAEDTDAGETDITEIEEARETAPLRENAEAVPETPAVTGAPKAALEAAPEAEPEAAPEADSGSSPAPLSLTPDENGEYQITSFAELKEFAAGTYTENTAARYSGTAPLEISEDLALGENITLIITGTLVVPEGVTLSSARFNGVFCNNLTVAGTIKNSGYIDGRVSMNVTGSIINTGTVALQKTDYPAAKTHITMQGENALIRLLCPVEDMNGFNELLTEAAASEESFLYYWFDCSTALSSSEDIVIPANCELSIMAGYTVETGATVTLNGEMYITSGATVSGNLINNGTINVFAAEGGKLTLASGGSYSGSGLIWAYKDASSFPASEILPGFNMDDFDVEYIPEGAWLIKKASSLPKPETPTQLEWNTVYWCVEGEDGSPSYKRFDAVGYLSWKRVASFSGTEHVEIYMEGQDEPVYEMWFDSGDSIANAEGYTYSEWDYSSDCDLESGTYYFKVTLEGDYETCSNSDTAISGNWDYVKPEKKMSSCSSPVWSDSGYSWTALEATSANQTYRTEVYYATTLDGERSLRVCDYSRATNCSMVNYQIFDDFTAGYYFVRVRALSDDITVACNGDWSEFSEGKYFEPQSRMSGDVNGDWAVDTKDFITLMKYLAEDNVTVVYASLDINGDGNQNTKDFITLMKYLAGEAVTIY